GDEVGGTVGRFLRADRLQGGQAGQRFGEHHLEFQAGAAVAQAEVRAVAGGQGRVRVPGDVEGGGVGERGVGPVGGRVQQQGREGQRYGGNELEAQAGESGAQAEVRAGAEGQVVVRVPGEVEGGGDGELGVGPVGGRVQQQARGARGALLSAEDGVRGGRAGH